MLYKKPNVRTVDEFHADISAEWRNSVQAIINVGRLLNQAKDSLTTNELNTLHNNLPFSPGTISKLKKIAADQNIISHVKNLPSSYGTLYELTHLSKDQFDRGLNEKIISPEMERRHVTAFRRQLEDEDKEEGETDQSDRNSG